MYKKIYGVNQAELSTLVNVNGSKVRIEFTGGVTSGSMRIRARYATCDPKIQAAIENDPRYGETIFSESVKEIQQKEKVVKKGSKIKEYKYIKYIQDAINILVTEYGYSPDNLQNKADVRKAAESKNISFPNMR